MVPDPDTLPSFVSGKASETMQPMRLDCIPILYTRGNYYTVGKAIGRVFKSMIQDMLASWPYFNETLWPAYMEAKGRAIYDQSLKLCMEKFPQYIQEIRGMADGCEVAFEKLFLLNIDSMMDDSEDTGRSATGCTSIICNKEEVILGHTEDAMCEILNNVYIVSAEIIDDCGKKLEHFTTFAYAGHLLGYTMGFNASGMIYSVNTLFPTVNKSGTPRAFIARAILAAKNLDSLLEILYDNDTGISDGMSINVHFGKDLEGLFYNIEVHPPSSLHAEDATLKKSLVDVLHIGAGESSVHCNKYLRVTAKEQSLPVAVSTNRQTAIEKHPKPSGLSDIKFLLSDQTDEHFPVYICDEIKTKVSHIKTVAVGVFNLIERTWSIYLGKPTESDPVAVLPLNF